MPRFAGALLALLSASTLGGEIGCSDWDDPGFFDSWSIGGIEDCLGRGLDPLARDDDGRTPLHYAAWHSASPGIVAALADAGADPDARDYDGRTPLHYAAEYSDSPGIVAELAAAGASPNARLGNGASALHIAAQVSAQLDSLLYTGRDGPSVESPTRSKSLLSRHAARAGDLGIPR